MTFCTGYTDHMGLPVMVPRMIALRYLQGWFICDIIAGIPWEWLSTGDSAARLTRSFRFVRAFRLLRLTRLLRLIKLKTLVDKVETFIEASQVFTFVVGIIRILLLLFAVTHWVACVWYVVGSGTEFEETWVKKAGLEGSSAWLNYIHSLYFSLTTMTTVGYGDITPQNPNEVSTALFILLISSIAFAGLMGTLMDLISELNRQKHMLAEKKMQLSRYMHWRIVPRKLMMAIRTHLLFLWDTNEGYDAYENELKSHLPPVLKMELCFHIYGRILSAAPFFSWMKDYACCVKQIANTVQCVFVERGDHLFRLGQANTQIYMLVSGSVWLSRNQMLWEDALSVRPGKNDSVPETPRPPSRDDEPVFAIPRHKETAMLDFVGLAYKNAKKKHDSSKELRKKKKEKQELVVGHFMEALAQKEEANQLEENQRKGLYVSDVMKDAEKKMKKHDEQLRLCAIKVQRHFRLKLKARREKARISVGLGIEDEDTVGMGATVSKSTSRSVTRMLSKTVKAPAYFGESCLWIPFDDWDIVPPPMYMYSARCESRGELIVIDRQDIHDLIVKFSPWLAERFEFFREAVVEGSMQHCDLEPVGVCIPGESGGDDIQQTLSYRLPIPIDWAAADLEMPETETVPTQAFQHMDKLNKASHEEASKHLQPRERSLSSRHEEVFESSAIRFASRRSEEGKDWALPPPASQRSTDPLAPAPTF